MVFVVQYHRRLIDNIEERALERFEPSTTSLLDWSSKQLSYGSRQENITIYGPK